MIVMNVSVELYQNNTQSNCTKIHWLPNDITISTRGHVLLSRLTYFYVIFNSLEVSQSSCYVSLYPTWIIDRECLCPYCFNWPPDSRKYSRLFLLKLYIVSAWRATRYCSKHFILSRVKYLSSAECLCIIMWQCWTGGLD